MGPLMIKKGTSTVPVQEAGDHLPVTSGSSDLVLARMLLELRAIRLGIEQLCEVERDELLELARDEVDQ